MQTKFNQPVWARQALAHVLLLLLSAACQDGYQGPEYASSVEHAAYAERYPDALDLQTQRVAAQRDAIAQFQNDMAAFPEQLENPDWKLVGEIYATADEEGRTRDYAERHTDSLTVQRFFEDNKKAIVGRVAGGAQHQAKEKNCDVELYGPVSFSFDRAMEKSLQERRRFGSPTQQLIEENEERLGKKNLEPLATQADQLALASHVAHIRLQADQHDLARLIDEADGIRSTLEDRIQTLETADKPDKEALSRAVTARNALEQRVERARAELEGAEERNKKLEDDYETAFARLQDAVEERASQARVD